LFIFGKNYFKKEKWGKRAWFNLGLELFRGVERDLNMLKTASIMKSPGRSYWQTSSGKQCLPIANQAKFSICKHVYQ